MFPTPLQSLAEVYSYTRGLSWKKYSLNDFIVLHFSEIKLFREHFGATTYVGLKNVCNWGTDARNAEIYPMVTGLWTPRFLFCQVSTQRQCRPGRQDCPIVPSVWRRWCCWTCCTLGSWTGCDCFFLPGERVPQQQQNNPLPHTLNVDDPIYEKHRVCWQVSAALQCRRVQRSCQTVRWASWPI